MHNVLWGDKYASNKDMGTLVLERELSRLWKNRNGIWSLFRPFIEAGRGVSKERLPLYAASFEFFRNVKNKREDALKELIKTCLKAPAKDLLNLERNLLPPILCPAILPTVF